MVHFIKSMLIVLLLNFIWNIGAHAATISAASCSSQDIQSAINNAKNGDLVAVPACTSGSWSSNVSIPDTKGITLQGAGSASTIIRMNGHGIRLQTSSKNSPLMITGFRFNHTNASETIIINGNAQDWRICYNIFDNNEISDTYDIRIGNNADGDSFTYGVIDHNQFINRNYSTSIFIEWPRGNLDPIAAGDWIWAQTPERGTSQAVFIEDNVFSGKLRYSQVVDSRWGAKYVLRYNTIHNPWISTHSGCTNWGRDPIWTEIYKNVLTDDGNRHYQWLQMRSTSGVFWGNTSVAKLNKFAMGIDHERSEVNCSGPYGPKCDGSQAYDENISGSFGYKCLGQPGWGQPQGSDMSSATFAGIFAWGNLDGGSLVDMEIVGGGYTSEHIKFRREIFNEADMTIGVIASRPGTCDAGPAGRDVYISTDGNSQGATLYICSATNTWIKHWEPYTYPHPLITGQIPDLKPSPPTRFRRVN